MFILTIVLFAVLPNKITSLANKYNALHFGSTTSDYISYTRDMTPFRNALTICMWIKRVHTSSPYPVVFHYQTSSETYEILIASQGEYNRVLDDRVLDNSHSYFQTPAGQWFSYCITWSRSTNTIQLYLNGQLVRSEKTGNWRELHTSGTLWFNKLANMQRNNYMFGGQLFQFNMFPEVLSAESIRKIAEGGLCFDMSEVSSVPVLKWEEVVAKSRSGNVREVTGCDVDAEFERVQEKLRNVKSELNSTKSSLDSVKSELNSTKSSLDSVTSELNSTKSSLDSVTSELNSTKSSLDSVKSELNSTKSSLNSVATRLTQTQKKLKKARKFENITQWDILYTSPYFNHFLTSELIDQLKSSWDVLGKLNIAISC